MSLRAGCVVACVVGALSAQERPPAFVTVVGADGALRAGANVTCVAWPGPFDVDWPDDRVQVVTDARGRAQPRLARSRIYLVTAEIAHVDGTWERTQPQPGCAAGCDQQLVLSRPTRGLDWSVGGLEAWRERGPLRVSLQTSTRMHDLASAAGLGQPAGWHTILVHDARGEPLWSVPVDGTPPWQQPVVYSPFRLTTVALRLPPPLSLPIRVRDASGAPVADAVLWRSIELEPGHALLRRRELEAPPAWARLGVTDAQGMATVTLATAVVDGFASEDLFVQARSPDRVAGHAGTIAYLGAFQGQDRIAVSDGILPITMPDPEPVRVHPPGRYRLVVRGYRADAPTSRSRQEGPVETTTGADGKARLLLPRDLKAQRLAQVHRDDGTFGYSVVELEPQGSFVWAPSRTVRVRVTDANGAPARGQVVALSAQPDMLPTFEVPLVADAGGGLDVRLGRGAWFVWCMRGEDAAWQRVPAGEGDVAVPLRLQPLPRFTFRFVDARGRSVVDRPVVAAVATNWDSSAAQAESVLLAVKQSALLAQWVHGTRTDAHGMLSVPTVPLPGLKASITFTLSPGTLGHTTAEVKGILDAVVDVVVD